MLGKREAARGQGLAWPGPSLLSGLGVLGELHSHTWRTCGPREVVLNLLQRAGGSGILRKV